jgi:hypothetical protein
VLRSLGEEVFPPQVLQSFNEGGLAAPKKNGFYPHCFILCHSAKIITKKLLIYFQLIKNAIYLQSSGE